MNKTLMYIKKQSEIISYLFWGVCTTVVSWGSYTLLMFCLDDFQILAVMSVLISNIFSWVCAVIFSFVTNKIFVFKSKSWKKDIFIQEAVKFVTTRFVTGVLEIILVPVLVFLGLDQKVLGIDGMLSKIVVSILVVVLNYICSKIFIFKSETR